MHGWHATGEPSAPPAWLEPSRLELLAWKAGLTADELREWLRGEVERRSDDASADDTDAPVLRQSAPVPGGFQRC